MDRPEQQGICDSSGFKFPMSELVRQWDGMLVHWRFVDKRNPQDLLRARPDNKRPHRTRPEPPDVFITDPYDITEEGAAVTDGGLTLGDH